MKFGYFTLGDNTYGDDARVPNEFIGDIIDEAIHAEAVGLHSAWIGEHHFNLRGVLSCPEIVLTHVAAATEKIRLAPGATILPMHHPVRVAEQWATIDMLSGGRVDFVAGRGHDIREYSVFNAPFNESQDVFAEAVEIVHQLWNDNEMVSHKGRHFQFDGIRITPNPIQHPIPIYVASFSASSLELAGRLGLNIAIAPFVAAMRFGGLDGFGDVYRSECAKNGHEAGRIACTYFLHFADNPSEHQLAGERQVRYFKDCVLDAMPSDANSAPPSYAYFAEMRDHLQDMKPDEQSDRAVLIGGAQKMIDTLKDLETAGISEVVLYFNVGLKPHQQVKDEMQRFMEEVAPSFN